ncbi:damage-inducible protein CinA [Desulfonema ishimotonii]|uniref:CinA-like protein n=1 Tax=Desulfonema ishimotonii TaxID=45657 RepID=A0A401FUY9_9BACT|nr:CinA family nicotinamide mononucleotide deamidase-related protein [Desulfonema ishimotonii]GBC60792.1 damage-inducible protein CinA [Desulfonema ishimotonii]
MIAEILSTGDEIRSGSLTDTNSAWLSQKLEEAGVDVTRHNCVGDDVPMLVAVMKEIGGRANLCLVTGGLGPTVDDLSAEAAARAACVGLIQNDTALRSIEAFFASRNLTMPDSNRKQAVLPESAQVLPNPVGTAPGFSLIIGECRFFFMPGVPYEMRQMMADAVMPLIHEIQGEDRPIHRIKTLSTFGLTESMAGQQVADVTSAFPGLKLGLRAKFPEIQIKFYASGKDEAALDRLLDEATRWVQGRLGDKVFSTTGASMAAVVGDLLREKGATLALAESCTGGLIASLMTDVSGSSDYFLFSGITYSDAAKTGVLGVSPRTLEAHGAVSEETVREMASGARRVAGATYGLATSGIAGPSGGTDEKPVGTVCIGLATPEKVTAYRFRYHFPRRAMNKSIFAMKALDILRRAIPG